MDLYFKGKISLPGGKLIMKKSVILLISCICIISIVIVAFFGVSAQNISPIIYITSVEILDMDGNEIPGNETNPDSKSFNITFNPTFENEGVQYMEYVFSTKIFCGSVFPILESSGYTYASILVLALKVNPTFEAQSLITSLLTRFSLE